MTLPSSSAPYTPWETIEVIANSDEDFACSRCGNTFALMALVSYAYEDEPLRDLKKAYPYWCHKCDTLPDRRRS